MASVAEKFYELMSIKRNTLIVDYEEMVYDAYPKVIRNGNNEDIDEFEKKFAKQHIDLKMEFYSLDCQHNLLKLILNKLDYTFYFELLIAFENLTWLEKLCKEFDCNAQESKTMIKLFLKHIIPFYMGDNVRTYNMAIAARRNAKISYTKDVLSSIEKAIKIISDPTIEIAPIEYLVMRENCTKLNEIIKNKKIDAIFSHPELLKEFGLSEEFLNEICKKTTEIKVEAPYKKEETPKLVVANEVEEDQKTLEERMSKYISDNEPVGLIEGEDLQQFLDLAKKLYPIEKVSLLKEKVFLNNKRINSEKREAIKSKIIHENDRDYYEFILSLDLTDPYYLPYASYIGNTITLIDGYIMDLMESNSDELAELYLEEISMLLDNMKNCIPFRKI